MSQHRKCFSKMQLTQHQSGTIWLSGWEAKNFTKINYKAVVITEK